MAQKVSRELKAYKGHSTAAIAARQLLAAGRELRPGQRARYLLMRGDPEVHAWDLPQPPDPRRVDLGRYRVLMLRVAAGVLQPFGVAERDLVSLLNGSEAQAELPMTVMTGVYSDVVEEWQSQPPGVIEVLPV
jgi:DNA polymerase elongation subunit (family B)